MKRTSLLIFWTLKVLLWAAICDGRHSSRCGVICRIPRFFLYNPCCCAGPPISRTRGLCEDCGGHIQCERDLCCRLEKGGVTGKCVSRSYAGRACDYRKEGELCEFCGGFAGIPCARGYFCKETNDNPDAGGVCLPDEGPLNPPKEGEICGSCGGFLGRPCNSNDLYCYIIGGDDGICLPRYGPGSDTYGEKGGVCDTCGPWTCTRKCQPDLYCERNGGLADDNGICLPGSESSPSKGSICQFCGGFAGAGCDYGLDCEITGGDAGICLPDDGPGFDTYGEDGGACSSCDPKSNDPDECQFGLQCRSDGICIPTSGSFKCDPRKGEEYTDCGTLCNKTCENYGKKEACALFCTAGCFCPSGTVRRECDDLCVRPEDCWWYD